MSLRLKEDIAQEFNTGFHEVLNELSREVIALNNRIHLIKGNYPPVSGRTIDPIIMQSKLEDILKTVRQIQENYQINVKIMTDKYNENCPTSLRREYV